MEKEVISKVFSLFVGYDDLRPVMQKPFEYEGKVYATDTYTCIRCDKKDYPLVIDNEHEPLKANNVFAPYYNSNLILNIDISIFEALKTGNEVKWTGKDVKCAECNGWGVVEWSYKSHCEDYDCPECSGDGYLERKKLTPTGNLCFGDHFVKIGKSYIAIKNFYKLIVVQRLIGEDIVLTNNCDSGNKAVQFQIGVFEIIIMPKMRYTNDDSEGIVVINIA